MHTTVGIKVTSIIFLRKLVQPWLVPAMPVLLALYLPDFRAVAIWNLEAMRLFVGPGGFWAKMMLFRKPETEFTCVNVSYFSYSTV